MLAKHGARKLSYLLRLQPARSIARLQAVRQDELQFREFPGPLGESLTLHTSFCGDSSADRIRGGVAVLLPRVCQAAGERVRSHA
eukprot:1767827-Pyramimonas_sp.AAC.1